MGPEVSQVEFHFLDGNFLLETISLSKFLT